MMHRLLLWIPYIFYCFYSMLSRIWGLLPSAGAMFGSSQVCSALRPYGPGSAAAPHCLPALGPARPRPNSVLQAAIAAAGLGMESGGRRPDRGGFAAEGPSEQRAATQPAAKAAGLQRRPQLLLIILAFLLPVLASAQPHIQFLVDSTELLIGDQLTARMRLESQEDVLVRLPNPTVYWSNEALEVIRISEQLEESSPDGLNSFEKKVTFTFWDTGHYQLPDLPILYQKDGQIDSLWLEVPMIRVKFPPGIRGDSSYVAPIKDIMDEPQNFIEKLLEWFFFYLPIIAVVFLILFAAVLGFLAYLLYKKAQARKTYKTPEERARIALKKLLAKGYLERQEWAEFHTDISWIIRSYLRLRFRVRALEATTNQLLDRLNYEQLEQSLLLELREVLETADLVKYAKASPLPAANDFSLKFIHKMLEYVERQEALRNSSN